MKKNLYTLALLLCAFLSATAQTKDVTLDEPGTLSTKIAESEKYTITSLKVSGPINGDDIILIRDMLGLDTNGWATVDEPALKNLDLSDANIVWGGKYYYKDAADNKHRVQPDTIGYYMFDSCNKLESLKLPRTTKYIDVYGLSYCSSLTSIDFGESLTGIDRYGCYGMTKVRHLVLPETLKRLEEKAFMNCPSVEDIDFGKELTYIGECAFQSCESLTELTFPEMLDSIEYKAFDYCDNVKTINFNQNLRYIGQGAFNYLANITELTFPESLRTIDANAFMQCTALTTIHLNEGLELIEAGAFMGCALAGRLTLPSTLQKLGGSVFTNYDQNKITEIYSLSVKPAQVSEEDNPFTGLDQATIPLYVPKGSSYDYKSTTWWENFKNIHEVEATGISAVSTDSFDSKAPVERYDLSGRRVQAGYKGVVIEKQGKKSRKVIMR